MALACGPIWGGAADRDCLRTDAHGDAAYRERRMSFATEHEYTTATARGYCAVAGYSLAPDGGVMNDYLKQVEAAIRATSIHSPTTYSWFGKRSPLLPLATRRKLTAETARSYLLFILQ